MRKSILLFILPAILAAAALAASSQDNEIIERARQMRFEFRQGNYAVATPLVEMLEKAVAKSPNNPALWESLGHANMARLGSYETNPPDIPKLLATAQRARDAYSRSLTLDPNNMLALASHGMASLVVSQFEGNGPGIGAAVEEMNEAVRRAPKSITVRLTRAFTTIQLPPAMRDSDAVIEDLTFILDHGSGGRPEDVVRLLLGDVYAETGKADAARAEYRQITGASAFAAQEMKFRLVDIDKGAIAPAAIAKVRDSTGSRCVTCHAAGTDN